MCSGSVIYAMHHEQDMRHMGGLAKKIPFTFWSMFIATLAIAGAPFFSGFLSKDMILASVLGYGQHHGGLSWLLVVSGFVTAGLTAFYMFRLVFMTFFGHPHDHHHYDEAHEGGWNMWFPLVTLAGLSLWVVYTGHVNPFQAQGWFTQLIQPPKLPILAESVKEYAEFEHHGHVPAMIASLVVATLGIFFSWLVFGAKKIPAAKLAGIWPNFVHKAIDNLYFFDWFYIKVAIQKGLMPFAKFWTIVDDKVVDRGMVDGLGDVANVAKGTINLIDDVVVDRTFVDGFGGGIPSALGSSLKVLQNGQVQRYLSVAVVALMLLFFFLRGVLF